MAILKTTYKSTGEVVHEQGGYDLKEITHWKARTLAELGDVYLNYEIIEEENDVC